MPYIKSSEIKDLLFVENYLIDTKKDWSDATVKIWNVVENLLVRQGETRNKAKKYMSAKRKIDKNYGRKKK